jgi:hypothetical protein
MNFRKKISWNIHPKYIYFNEMDFLTLLLIASKANELHSKHGTVEMSNDAPIPKQTNNDVLLDFFLFPG